MRGGSEQARREPYAHETGRRVLLGVAAFWFFSGSGWQAGAGLALGGFIRHLARSGAVRRSRVKWGVRPLSDGSRVARGGRTCGSWARANWSTGAPGVVGDGGQGGADRVPGASRKRGVARGGGWCGEGRAKCLMNPTRGFRASACQQ
jgi:hypothetical protein